jgi:hypothetical protein
LPDRDDIHFSGIFGLSFRLVVVIFVVTTYLFLSIHVKGHRENAHINLGVVAVIGLQMA